MYDQGGNRAVKIDNIANRRVIYTYDISAPTTYNSDNNRLMYYETYDTSVTPWVPLSTTWYSYNTQGNATRIVTESTTPNQPVQATRFVYNHSQQVSYIVGEQWYRGNSDCNTYTISYAREFRYDAARARYLNRELDPGPNGLMHTPYAEFVALSETWTDYDGDESYGDFEIDAGTPPTIDNLRSFEPGLSAKDPDDQSSGVSYYHSDMLGTRRGRTGRSSAAPPSSAARRSPSSDPVPRCMPYMPPFVTGVMFRNSALEWKTLFAERLRSSRRSARASPHRSAVRGAGSIVAAQADGREASEGTAGRSLRSEVRPAAV